MDLERLSDVMQLISDIKHKVICNPHDVAVKTEELLEALISNGNWTSAMQLMELIRMRIKCIAQSLPMEGIATNITRHILKIVCDEFELASEKKGESNSLHQIVRADSTDVVDYSESLSSLKAALLKHLSEYKSELESSADNIAAQAPELIHNNETILTIGMSEKVEMFLKSAAKSRKFNVVVAEAAPLCKGHDLAASLVESKIKVTVVSDAAIFAMMSRVNKVVIGTQMVLGNGGLRAQSGSHTVALCARHFAVPVFVLCHMYEFSTVSQGSVDDATFYEYASPAEILPLTLGPMLNDVTVINPRFDYVPPELISLLITHQGGNSPSYVYRLLSELYHPDDY
ncbi:hypothetical protein HUJ04_011836 [Dendroctonus ponderosae]